MSDRCKNPLCRWPKVSQVMAAWGYCDRCYVAGVPELIARAEAAEAELARYRLRWTDEPPKGIVSPSGTDYYWHFVTPYPMVVCVSFKHAELCVFTAGSGWLPIKHFKGRWAGPIPLPVEDET